MGERTKKGEKVIKEEKVSRKINDFLEFIEKCKKDYIESKNDLDYKEKQTQDILHSMELHNLNYKERAKLSTKLKEVRQERRKSKNKLAILNDFIKYIEIAGNINIPNLKKTLLEVRKIEKNIETSIYIPRTDILKK